MALSRDEILKVAAIVPVETDIPGLGPVYILPMTLEQKIDFRAEMAAVAGITGDPEKDAEAERSGNIDEKAWGAALRRLFASHVTDADGKPLFSPEELLTFKDSILTAVYASVLSASSRGEIETEDAKKN